MKRSLALLVLVALAALTAAPAAAARRTSLRGRLDLSLDSPVGIPDGAKLTRRTAALSSITDDRLSRSLRSGRISPARFALERAESALRGEFDGDLSLLLADLALRVRDLSGRERSRALDVLARPTDVGPDNIDNGYSYRGATTEVDCGTHFCIHWAETGRHRISTVDGADANSTPDYVDRVQTEMEHVWDAQVETLGFKAPKSDASSRQDDVSQANAGKLDVYLLDSGSDGVYGYCGTDDPNLLNPFSGYDYFDGSSYCGLDNDFLPSQFRGAPSLESLRVTAAHEFFHAIQLAYSAGHDTWLAEGTAALMEDVVYDDIDDNYQYLSASSMRRPAAPLDKGRAPFHYGVWLFWRFLTELPSAPQGPALGIDVIRETWEQAAFDGPAAPALRASFAVKKALSERRLSFDDAKAYFSVVNLVPELFYEEGAGYLEAVAYKRPPSVKTFTLGSGDKTTGTWGVGIDHLSAGYVTFKPGAGVQNVRVAVDLPAARTAPRATLVTVLDDGSAFYKPFSVNSSGVGTLDLQADLETPFTRATVQKVVLVLDNASTRYSRCQNVTPWRCGKPLDDDARFAFAATAQ